MDQEILVRMDQKEFDEERFKKLTEKIEKEIKFELTRKYPTPDEYKELVKKEKAYCTRLTLKVISCVSEEFLYWFVGFVEANQNDPFQTEYFERIWFNLSVRKDDLAILFFIKHNLKKLKIKNEIIMGLNKYSFIVTDERSILKLMCLFNGRFYIREYFSKYRMWCAIYVSIYRTFETGFHFFEKTMEKIKGYNVKQLVETAWLTGFLDGRIFFSPIEFDIERGYFDGSIYIAVCDQNEIGTFEQICRLYGGKMRVFERKRKKRYFLAVHILKSIKLVKYLEKYLLQRAPCLISLLRSIYSLGIGIFLEKRYNKLFARHEGYKTRFISIVRSFNNLLNDRKYEKFQISTELLGPVWLPLIEKRRHRREKHKGGKYYGFFERKYAHFLKRKISVISKLYLENFLSLELIRGFKLFRFYGYNLIKVLDEENYSRDVMIRYLAKSLRRKKSFMQYCTFFFSDICEFCLQMRVKDVQELINFFFHIIKVFDEINTKENLYYIQQKNYEPKDLKEVLGPEYEMPEDPLKFPCTLETADLLLRGRFLTDDERVIFENEELLKNQVEKYPLNTEGFDLSFYLFMPYEYAEAIDEETMSLIYDEPVFFEGEEFEYDPELTFSDLVV